MSRNSRTNKGVVLAAGEGTRSRASFTGPKPLVPVAVWTEPNGLSVRAAEALAQQHDEPPP